MYIQTTIIRIYLCQTKEKLLYASHLYINIVSYCKCNFLINYY